MKTKQELFKVIEDACDRAVALGHELDSNKKNFKLTIVDGKFFAPDKQPVCPMEAVLLGKEAYTWGLPPEYINNMTIGDIIWSSLCEQLGWTAKTIIEFVSGYDNIIDNGDGKEFRNIIEKKYNIIDMEGKWMI